MKLLVHAATDIGRVRQNNEDSFLVDETAGIFAVADGLGGLEGGEIASQTAVATIVDALKNRGAAALDDLSKLLLDANEAVVTIGRKSGILQMGTTLTMAHVVGDSLRLAHVGDSFALRVRDGTCTALTREHNVENDNKGIHDFSPYPPSYRHALTRVIGQTEPLKVDVIDEKLAEGDWLVLATDGLTDCVTYEEIGNICDPGKLPEQVVTTLITTALESSGHDNITVVAIHCISE